MISTRNYLLLLSFNTTKLRLPIWAEIWQKKIGESQAWKSRKKRERSLENYFIVNPIYEYRESWSHGSTARQPEISLIMKNVNHIPP